jgi:hypothetical protein
MLTCSSRHSAEAGTSLYTPVVCQLLNSIRYAYAQHWGHLASSIQRSAEGSPCDEMIELCHGSRITSPSSGVSRVRRVIHRELRELPSIINAQEFRLNADVAPFIPTFTNASVVIDGEEAPVDSGTPSPEEHSLAADGEAEEPNADDTLENVEAVDERTLQAETFDRSVGDSLPWDCEDPVLSERRKKAARLIGAAYRHVLSRRKGLAKAGLAANRATLCDAYLTQARQMDWPNRYYRLLFQGPLVHALLCLEVVQKFSLSLKEKAKKRSLTAKYQELEEVGRQRTLSV